MEASVSVRFRRHPSPFPFPLGKGGGEGRESRGYYAGITRYCLLLLCAVVGVAFPDFYPPRKECFRRKLFSIASVNLFYFIFSFIYLFIYLVLSVTMINLERLNQFEPNFHTDF